MDPQVVTLIIALAGGIGSVLSFFAGRRERNASAMSDEGSAAVQISEGYMKLVTALEKRVESLERENEESRAQIAVLENENSELRRQVGMLEDVKYQLEHTVSDLENRLSRVENLTNGRSKK